MKETINRVELLGHIGQIRISAGEKEAGVSIATSRVYVSGGNPVIETTWHSVIVRNNVIDFALLKKGGVARVEGFIRNRSYTAADGYERVITEIVATKCEVEEWEQFPRENQLNQ